MLFNFPFPGWSYGQWPGPHRNYSSYYDTNSNWCSDPHWQTDPGSSFWLSKRYQSRILIGSAGRVPHLWIQITKKNTVCSFSIGPLTPVLYDHHRSNVADIYFILIHYNRYTASSNLMACAFVGGLQMKIGFHLFTLWFCIIMAL